MSELVAGAAAITAACILLASATEHLWRPTALPRALRAHRIVPGLLVVPAAAGVVLAEGAVGGATAAAALSGDAALLRTAASGAALLSVGYLAYGWAVRRARPRAACGCTATTTPVTGWVLARAGACALLAAPSAAWPQAATALAGPRLAVAVLAGTAFAVLVRELPTALFDPAELPAGTADFEGTAHA